MGIREGGLVAGTSFPEPQASTFLWFWLQSPPAVMKVGLLDLLKALAQRVAVATLVVGTNTHEALLDPGVGFPGSGH